MTGRVAREFGAKSALDPQVNRQGPGPNQRHVAFENIHKLRQFIKAKRAEDFADRCNTVVVSLDRLRSSWVGTSGMECTKLEDLELSIVETKPFLSEQDGTRTSELNKRCYREEQRPYKQDEQGCADAIYGRFHRLLKRVQRPLQHRRNTDVSCRSNTHIRRHAFEDYETDVGSCPFQLSHDSCYSFSFSDRRGEQYTTDMAAAHKCGQSIYIRFSLSRFLTWTVAVGKHFYPKPVCCTAYPPSCSRCAVRRSDDCNATFKPGRAKFP